MPLRQPLRMRLIDFLVIVLVLVYVWRIQDLYGFLGTLQLPTVVSVFALVVFFFGDSSEVVMKRVSNPLLKYSAFILAAMLLSVPTSVYPGHSLAFITNDHIKTLLMMLVIAGSIRGFADVERVALANVLGAAIYCVKILTTFTIGADGRLAGLYFYDANDLGMLIVCTLPLVVYFIGRPGPIIQGVALAAAAVFVMALVKTGSRGAFLGLVGVGVFLLFGFRAIPVRFRVGAVVAGVVMLMAFAGDQYWALIKTLLNPTADYNFSANSEAGRMAIWKRGIGYFFSNPIAGVGVSAFGMAEGMISELAGRQAYGIGVKWSAAHNSFVQVMAELGAPGIIAFLLLLWHFFDQNRRIARTPQPNAKWSGEHALAQALIGSLVGYMISGFFLSQGYAAYLYCLIGLQVGFWATTRPPVVAGTNPKAFPGRQRRPWTPQRAPRPRAAPLPVR
jgi:O-antigen ligase